MIYVELCGAVALLGTPLPHFLEILERMWKHVIHQNVLRSICQRDKKTPQISLNILAVFGQVFILRRREQCI